MKTIKRIQGTNGTSLILGLHVDMQERLYALISKVAPASISLDPADITAWRKAIDTEQDLSKDVADSETTDRLKKKDVERDRIIVSLFSEIRSAMLSLVEEKAAAARRLYPIVKAYQGLQNESIGEETAHIEGLIVDLCKNDVLTDVNKVGVVLQLNMLKQANVDFKAIRVERAHTSAIDKLPSSKIIRKQVDDITSSILFHIEASYLMAADADKPALGVLIDDINQVIQETKTANKQGMAQRKKAADKKKPDGGKKPSDPKKPDDTKKPDDGKTPKPGREEDPGEDKV